MKTIFQRFAIVFMMVSFTAGATEIFVDTDHDNVPDWGDYCPNTPAGKRSGLSRRSKPPREIPDGLGARKMNAPQAQASLLPRASRC